MKDQWALNALTFLGSHNTPRSWEKSASQRREEDNEGKTESWHSRGYMKLDRLSPECTGDQPACRGAAPGSESGWNLRQAQTKPTIPAQCLSFYM